MGYPTDDDFRDARFYAPPPGASKKPLPVKVKKVKKLPKPCDKHSDYWPLVGAHRRAVHEVERLTKAADVDKASALSVIAQLYVAVQRKGWEKGPTISEAIKGANDYYYAQFGYEGEPASEALIKIGGGVVKEIGS